MGNHHSLQTRRRPDGSRGTFSSDTQGHDSNSAEIPLGRGHVAAECGECGGAFSEGAFR